MKATPVPPRAPHEFVPIETERAFSAVARAIEEKILNGDLPVGSVLPGEFALAEAFGVHRSTLREALRVVEQEGLLLRSKGGKRLIVRAPAKHDVASRMTAAIVLQEVSFLELWETMLALEPAAAAAAAERATPDCIAELEENLEQTRQALGDPERLVTLDVAFHEKIAEASHNRALQLCRASIGQLFYPAFLPVMAQPKAGRRLLEAHEAIVAALKARDVETARHWMRRHIEDFHRGYKGAELDVEKPVAWPPHLRRRDREAVATGGGLAVTPA